MGKEMERWKNEGQIKPDNKPSLKASIHFKVHFVVLMKKLIALIIEDFYA